MVVWFIDASTEKGLMISGQKALQIYLLIPCRTDEADATLHALKPQGVSTPVYFISRGHPNFRSFKAFIPTARFSCISGFLKGDDEML